jgi:hypothetical protein
MSPAAADSRRREPRFSFLAAAEAVDLQNGARTQGKVENISRSGCFLDTRNTFIVWTRIKLRITRGSQCLEIEGLVVHSQPQRGMGISFDKLTPPNQVLLSTWLRELSA